jgi:hypothetical protein
MEPGRLLDFCKEQWNRNAQAVADEEAGKKEEELLCVAFLALLHSLGSIRQEQPSLPRIRVVQDNIERLFKLAAWKFWLESQRFKFPVLSLSKLNDNLDFKGVGDYLDVCYSIRTDYEQGVTEAKEEAKLRETERALEALNNTWITPVSRKILWRWIKSHLPDKYSPDAEGWLQTLFLGGKVTILSFEKEDIQLSEEIIVSSMPHGTGIGRAVRSRLEEISSTWNAHYEAWEIIEEDATDIWVNGERQEARDPGPEPRLETFSSRGSWLQAMAKWRIESKKWSKQ